MALLEFERQLAVEPGFITDEVVVITETIPEAVDYYRGYMNGLTNDEILGNTHLTCGAFTAVEYGGTRYEVIKAGLPGDNQVLIERSTGRLITNSPVTLYVSYKWFARIYRASNGGSGERIFSFPNTLLNCGSNLTLYSETMVDSLLIRAFTVVLQQAPVGAVRVSLLNGISGSSVWRVDFDSGDVQKHKDFGGTLMALTVGDVLNIRVNANMNNAVGPHIILHR